MKFSFTMFLATGFFSGYLPKAPGTWGSLAAVPLWFLLSYLDVSAYGLMLVAVFLVGWFVAGEAEKILDKPDPGCVVIDEIFGMFITLFAAPRQLTVAVAAFLLFRLFDIWKPFPVSWFDRRVNGGLGIMLDDAMAGIYAFLTLRILFFFGL
ncbi:MAG: phosphatidylglycerophosphatase A [Desulfobulbaceae bacterium]|jgi:phosphatidylglycerophosphatase A|nr:phosphatidylglycerophosphatase A [Desulfobulbaceae bacterium]